MCVFPRTVFVNGRAQQIACRECKACLAQRRWDWAGRCIAEAETADHARMVTLTYGVDLEIDGAPDKFGSHTITPRDFQRFMKRLRKAGYRVRFLCVAEYGTRKNRVHWHAILFFNGGVPDLPLDVRLGDPKIGTPVDPYWPHGFSYWSRVHAASAAYVTKYITKTPKYSGKLQESGGYSTDQLYRREWASLSRKPVLGAEWLQRRADRHAEQRLSIQSLEYSFPHIRAGKGLNAPVRIFRLKKTSAAADLYLGRFVETWQRLYGNDRWPYSELVEDYLDRNARPDVVIKPREYRRRAKPHCLPDGADARRMVFSERLNMWTLHHQGQRLYWSYLPDGAPGWSAVIVSEAQAERWRKAAYGDGSAYAEASQASGRKRSEARGGAGGGA